jgi:GH43 family beta-xylosidase
MTLFAALVPLTACSSENSPNGGGAGGTDGDSGQAAGGSLSGASGIGGAGVGGNAGRGGGDAAASGGTGTAGVANDGAVTDGAVTDGAGTDGQATGGTGAMAGGSGGGGTAGEGGASRMQWTNPIVPQRADPHVLLHGDGYYYLAATVPQYDRVELRRARTIGDLATAQPKVVWTRPAQGTMAGPIWAPEIHFLENKWFVYFSAGAGGQPWDSIRIFAIESASANPLESSWTVRGQVPTKWDSFSLDATTFAHEGIRYFVWTQVEPGRVGTNIMIARMASALSLTGEQVILSRPEYSWETQGGVWVNEAPAVLVKNGRVFITYSASATDHNYCMGLLTASASANLLDPRSWAKSPQPVFQSSGTTSQYGPGHNSFTTTPDGTTDILVYHSRNYKDIPGGNPLGNPDRATRAQVLPWNANGMPEFGVPVADGSYTVPAISR